MKLYFVPKTRATRPRWLLEELGVPYELVRLDPRKGETRTPEQLKISPLGHVPALVDGDLKMIESAAICLYLADKFPEKHLAPPPQSPDRAAYYQWIVFAMVTLEPPLSAIAHYNRATPEGQRDAALVAKHAKDFEQVAKPLEDYLRGREFVAGQSFTAADVVVGSVAAWAGALHLLDSFPTLKEYGHRMADRPAAKRSRDE